MSSFQRIQLNKISDIIDFSDKKLKEVDEKGRLNLSIKQANPDFFTKREEVPKPMGDRGPRKDFKKRY